MLLLHARIQWSQHKLWKNLSCITFNHNHLLIIPFIATLSCLLWMRDSKTHQLAPCNNINNLYCFICDGNVALTQGVYKSSSDHDHLKAISFQILLPLDKKNTQICIAQSDSSTINTNKQMLIYLQNKQNKVETRMYPNSSLLEREFWYFIDPVIQNYFLKIVNISTSKY